MPLKNYRYLIPVSILCCLFVFMGPINPVGAEEFELEPVVVTATRAPIPAAHAAANVVVLTREELEALPARNAAEALAVLPGVFIDQNGGFGSQATAGIYGSEARHVAVYVDSVPRNLLANPIADLAGISLNRIERIEVYKGTASSVWGSSLGGVINIITREPLSEEAVSGRVRQVVGEDSTWITDFRLEGQTGKTGYLVSAIHSASDGFALHRDYDQDSVYLKVRHEPDDESRLTVSASFDRSEKSDPRLYGSGEWEKADQDRNYQVIEYETRVGSALDLRLHLHRQVLDSSLDYQFERETVNSFTYTERSWGFSAQGGYRHVFPGGTVHTVSLGLDREWADYEYSPLGREIATGNQDVWVSEIIDLERWTFSLGARVDDNQDFGSQLSPSAGLVFRPLDMLLLRASWSRGFSAPPLSYLYDPDYGNSDLGPETGTTWQVGAEAEILSGLIVTANYFQADLEDMIYFDPGRAMLVNLDEVHRSGWELGLNLDLGTQWSLDLGGTWVEVTNTRTDSDVPDIPTRIFNAGITHHRGGLTQSLNCRWTDYNSSEEDTLDKRPILDYLARYQWSNGLALQVSIHNLTGETEYHWWYLPHAGRRVLTGLSYSF